MNKKIPQIGTVIILFLLSINTLDYAQQPYRKGTTAANFLEIGYGSSGTAMGDAVVSTVNDLSSIYWNPAGLALMRQSGVQFTMQPWIADINISFASAGIVLPRLGTLAAAFYQVSYGKEPVTTMAMQEGTGANYTAADYCINLSYARRLAQWFAFGASTKLVSSRIWHTSASAFAVDLGAVVNTAFFSPTGNSLDGIAIGMSISNYGTRMKYDGMDLLQPIDPDPSAHGNFDNVEGQYKTQGWELPLIFRIGVAANPLVTERQKLTFEVDALHPNNNSESINIGAQYAYTIHSYGSFYLRGGYKGLLMVDSEYGASYGVGFLYRVSGSAIQIDYSFRDIGILGSVHSYSFSFLF